MNKTPLVLITLAAACGISNGATTLTNHLLIRFDGVIVVRVGFHQQGGRGEDAGVAAQRDGDAVGGAGVHVEVVPLVLQDEIRDQVKKMALELGVVGLMNVQMAVQGEDIYVIEVNPRASRTVPFVSKCVGESLA